MTTLTWKYVGWLLIGVADKKYVPVVDLNPEEFKQQETPINSVI